MKTPLGKPTEYRDEYDAARLAPMDRAALRQAAGLGADATHPGIDLWRSYEFSWLAATGLPRVAGLVLEVDARSPRMVESKSMKLYLNGFSQTAFDDEAAVLRRLTADLQEACGAPVEVRLVTLPQLAAVSAQLPGICLDDLDVAVDSYLPDPDLLAAAAGAQTVEETVHTELFRSVCPVTGQPDWASLLIRYQGAAIDHRALLAYLVSYRRHAAFHETTVERIFEDLTARCGCRRLLVAGYFTRRGGIDISPIRADAPDTWPLLRTARQ